MNQPHCPCKTFPCSAKKPYIHDPKTIYRPSDIAECGHKRTLQLTTYVECLSCGARWARG